MPVSPATASAATEAPVAFVVGEALVDVVARAEGVVEHPGGSPMNVAIGLARLGVPTELHTRIGDDERGREVRRHLEDSGVALTPSSVDSAATSVAEATIGPDGAASYRFAIDGRLAEAAVPAGVRLVHTGSIAAVLEPGATLIAALLADTRATALVSLDPNVRPAITPDADVVREHIERLCGLAHIVKLSDEDAAWLYPGLALEDVVARLRGLGPQLAAVTRGGDGCLIAAGDLVLALPAPPVVVTDTIGAGDAFMSGMLAAVLDGAEGTLRAGSLDEEELRRIAGLALRTAAATVERAGANPPTRAELGLPAL